jgi:hypothetical protein
MTSRSLSLSASLLLAAVVACGGAQPNQPAPMAPVTPAEPTAPAAPAVAATDPAAPATAPAATPARPTTRGPNLTADGVVFNFKPDGKPAKIFLAGNFNSWNPSDPKFLLKNDGPSGMWSITVKLAPGTYQYKFVADGQWIKDPSAPGSAPDGFGGQNGQFDVK